jgi:spore coat polysaccharide biosynthesis protein SpsF
MDDKHYVFLTVRASSTRLPRKCLLPFGSYSVLEHVISRAKSANLIPVVCTSIDQTDNEIEDLCKENGVLYFRGSLGNKLLRWYDCSKVLNVSNFHTVDVDDPFFDPDQVRESLLLLQKEKLDLVFPTAESAAGSASVGYSVSVAYLEEILLLYRDLDEIEMVDAVFGQYTPTKSKVLVSKIRDSDQIRLTLDYEEDYHLLLFVLRELGPNCSRAMILELFSRNPDLFKINWFRNDDWAAKQNLGREYIKERIQD